MDSDTTQTTPIGGAAAEMHWMTTTTLVLIAIGIVAAIAVIAFGMKLSRQRKAAAKELAEQQGTTEVTAAPVTEQTIAEKPAPEPTPAPAAETAPALPVEPPPPPPTPPVAPPAPTIADADIIATPSTGGDDLTRLKGLGPKVAARLNELGVTSLTQLAALSPTEAEALDAQLGTFKGRMARDRWIEQASYLSKGDTVGFEASFGRL